MDKLVFTNHLKKYLDEENILALMNELEIEDHTSCILVDEDKISLDTIKQMYPSLINHPQVKNAFIFDKKLELGKSLLFELGAYYIFEPCSALVNYILSPNENDIVLDCAASPGGKAIHASFLMHNKGQIIANEINQSRAEVLSSNSEKYGRKNMTITSSSIDSLEEQFPNYFTKIILDAPCSGSGMIKKEPKMGEDWTLNKVLSLASLQKELILKAYNMLTPGGDLIYSTCSYSYEEDEEVIQYLLNNSSAELKQMPNIKGSYISKSKIGIHLLPHLYHGDGHYICLIHKPGNLTYPQLNYKNPNNKFINKLTSLGDIFINKNNEVYLTNHILNVNKLKVLRNGIKVGVIDNKLGLIYDHNFSRINLDILPTVPLTLDETLSYLEGNTIANKNYEDGYVILTYLNIPFSLAKITKKTIKNHYPKGLRKKIKNNCN